MLKFMIGKAFLAKATAVLAGLGLATGGAAATNALPQVAQDRVAAAVEKVSSLDLPNSQDTDDGTEAPEEAQRPKAQEKAADPDGTDDGKQEDSAAKPEQPAKDNFGSWVSTQARSGDKGPRFGETVSAQARANAAARQAARSGDDPDDDKAEDEDEEAPTAQRQRPATPGAQGNHGSRPRR